MATVQYLMGRFLSPRFWFLVLLALAVGTILIQAVFPMLQGMVFYIFGGIWTSLLRILFGPPSPAAVHRRNTRGRDFDAGRPNTPDGTAICARPPRSSPTSPAAPLIDEMPSEYSHEGVGVREKRLAFFEKQVSKSKFTRKKKH